MSEYEGKKRGICPFSELDTFIKNNDCGMFQFCDCCDDYFKAYDKGRADGFQEALTDAGIVIYTDKLKADGAKEFSKWLKKHCNSDGYIAKGRFDELLAEWQKVAENE